MEHINPNALKPGSQLEEYQIIKILGSGGFGITYLAFDQALKINVAIKEYLPDIVQRNEQMEIVARSEASKSDYQWGLELFWKEAVTLAQFQYHPHIVHVARFFKSKGTAYIVMEYVEGQTLTEKINQLKQLTEEETRYILEPIINDLTKVHAKDVFHRDIKSDNIIIRNDGKPVLIDFGAARHQVGTKTRNVTAFVTDGFTPPEQYATKSKLGPWVDVYALGAVAYHCVTGNIPEASLNRQLEEDHTSAVESPTNECSPEFLKAIDSALILSKAKRPQSLPDWLLMLNANNDKTSASPKQQKSQENQKSHAKVDAKHQEELQQDVPKQTSQRTDQKEVDASENEDSFGSLLVLFLCIAIIIALALALENVANSNSNLKKQLVPKKQLIPKKIESIGIKMINIPAGRFRMGDIQGVGEDDEKPVHWVDIPAFKMSETEVTFAQWDTCVAEGGCSHRPDDLGWGRGNNPVIDVSWNDITQQFIPWLNKVTGQTYRLPTEAEWEYAARAGTTTKYPWGNKIDCSKARYGFFFDECGNQLVATGPVKSFPPNAFGLYDMHGNVWEWVQDCHNDSYKGAPDNGSAWMKGNCDLAVRRGGSLDSSAWFLRSANRLRGYRTDRDSGYGFRLAQDLD